MRNLILACAGAGKSTRIIEDALSEISKGNKVLLLTYTQRNQSGLQRRLWHNDSFIQEKVNVKGWFTFLLEDIIRPYQLSLFRNRVSGICFNSNGDPNKRGNYYINGRKEKINGSYNSRHFLTEAYKAHTFHIAKLAYRVINESSNSPIKRLEGIYTAIYIDEFQDLVGWDYQVLKKLSDSSISKIWVVGDLRQTLYSTSMGTKNPRTSAEKIQTLKKDLNFTTSTMNMSWRCLDPICNLANLVHRNAEYEDMISGKKHIPVDYEEHTGLFLVPRSRIMEYIETYSPAVLRLNKNATKDFNLFDVYNFGESKGLEFPRTLIFTTKKYIDFLSGKKEVFKKDRSEKSQNSLYVAITRSTYSVAFVYDDKPNKYLISLGFQSWQ